MPPAPIHVREVPKPAHDRACTLFERRGGERKNINTRGLLERRTERSAKGQPRLGPDKRQEGGAALFFSPAFLRLFSGFSYTFLILLLGFKREEKEKKRQEKEKKSEEKTKKSEEKTKKRQEK